MEMDPDARLLIGGRLLDARQGEIERSGLVRLNPGPSIDESVILFSAPNQTARESDGEKILLLVREGPTDEPVSVEWETRDGSARACWNPADVSLEG
jgi:hypothetical protein